MPAQPTTSTPWLEKLSPELRIKVFESVLRHERILVCPSEEKTEQKLNISLLTALVNDARHEEAYEVFYAKNTFRIYGLTELRRFICDGKPADSLSLRTNFINEFEYHDLPDDPPSAWLAALRLCVKARARLPKIKRLTISYQTKFAICLTETVGRLLTEKDGYNLRAVAVGKYVLTNTLWEDFQIYLKHPKMYDTWLRLGLQPDANLGKTACTLSPALLTRPNLEWKEDPFREWGVPQWIFLFEKACGVDRWYPDSSHLTPVSAAHAWIEGFVTEMLKTLVNQHTPTMNLMRRINADCGFLDVMKGVFAGDKALDELNQVVASTSGLIRGVAGEAEPLRPMLDLDSETSTPGNDGPSTGADDEESAEVGDDAGEVDDADGDDNASEDGYTHPGEN